MKTLYLLPNLLHEDSPWRYQPPPIDALIAESEKGGRQFLKKLLNKSALPIYLLNEHTQDIAHLLTLTEEKIGLISDAGLPCLADPGSQLVSLARKNHINIEAIPGPSSIFLSLMLSGLSAQRFTFHGYLNRELPLLQKQLLSLSPQMTHIFIETPYRNEKLLSLILKTRQPKDLLCVAWDLTAPSQTVISQPIFAWKTLPVFQKKPAIFLLYI